jgi:hypothetical protein
MSRNISQPKKYLYSLSNKEFSTAEIMFTWISSWISSLQWWSKTSCVHGLAQEFRHFQISRVRVAFAPLCRTRLIEFWAFTGNLIFKLMYKLKYCKFMWLRLIYSSVILNDSFVHIFNTPKTKSKFIKTCVCAEFPTCSEITRTWTSNSEYFK